MPPPTINNFSFVAVAGLTEAGGTIDVVGAGLAATAIGPRQLGELGSSARVAACDMDQC